MRIFLVRHARAESGSPDELRPLSEDGRAQARELARRLAAADPAPDAVVSSPLLRARETAAAIARELGVAPSTDDRLAPGADAEGVVEAARAAGERVVVVGHQPDCGEVALVLTGVEPPFPAAGMVEIDVDA